MINKMIHKIMPTIVNPKTSLYLYSIYIIYTYSIGKPWEFQCFCNLAKIFSTILQYDSKSSAYMMISSR